MVWISVLLILVAVTIIFIGMLLIFISTLARGRKAEGRSEAGGVIVLGPIPIVFGTSERIVKSLIIISIVFFIVVLAIFIILSSGMPILKR